MRCPFKALVATGIYFYKLAAWSLSADPGGSKVQKLRSLTTCFFTHLMIFSDETDGDRILIGFV